MSTTLLKLQIGPVQEFIAQARSTRDLWSGSYLISWMMAKALHCLVTPLGPNCVVFPALVDGDATGRLSQPLVRWMRDKHPTADNTVEQVLTPNLPNILVALVPGSWNQEMVEQTIIKPMQEEWRQEMIECLEYYRSRCPFSQDEARLFQKQAERFWQINWQLWECKPPASILPMLGILPGINTTIEEIRERARNSPHAEVDLEHDWAAQFALASHRLDARRQTRNFNAWRANPLATRDKDSLSGREEAIADQVWLAAARKHSDLRYRFRSGDQLGAPNLIKRIWDLAYLRKLGLQRPATYDSVPAVAAAPWLARLKERISDDAVEAALWNFVNLAMAAQAHIPEPIFPRADGQTLLQWLDRVDACIFHESTWDNWSRPEPDQPPFRPETVQLFLDIKAALDNLYHVLGAGKPGRYFAILALDGDSMGTWLSGAKCPLTEMFHRNFSRSLAEFSLDKVRPIVEQSYGQIIYAGGDDVLAMLPAETALTCANKLAQRFRESMEPVAPGCTASIGLAIAHLKAPLQDLVEVAQSAEKRAKSSPESEVWNRKNKRLEWQTRDGWNRDAIAIALFKRSGETIHWGAKFGSAAFALLDELRMHYRPPVNKPMQDMPISGGFPHRIAELLGRYNADQPLDQDLLNIAKAELAWAIQQQTWKDDKAQAEGSSFRRKAFTEKCLAYLDELFAFRWKRRASDLQETAARRPLRNFINLFLIEAFIARQGE